MSDTLRGSAVAMLWQRAGATAARIGLPEAADPRTREAAHLLAAGGVRPVLIGTAAELAGAESLNDVTLLDPFAGEIETRTRQIAEAAPRLARLEPAAREARLADPLTRAAALLCAGELDGVVAGAVHTTADVVRTGLALLGLAPGVETVSSAFLMELPDAAPARALGRRAFLFADCGVVPEPAAAQLADIALAAARLATELLAEPATVAFLSFATAGSADGDSPRRVREACALASARAEAAGLRGARFVGETQADAALLPGIAQRKGLALGAPANVLVFPSLDAGNIAYKLVERLAGARAVGPLLAGFPLPYHDLSRGASAEDIALAGCVAAVQAASNRPRPSGPSSELPHHPEGACAP